MTDLTRCPDCGLYPKSDSHHFSCQSWLHAIAQGEPHTVVSTRWRALLSTVK